MLTDQGANFISTLMKDVCQLLGIEKIQTSAYHPKTNGMIERAHRTIKDTMSHYVNKTQQDWDTWIPCFNGVSLFYSQFNGLQSLFLLHGRDPILPIDSIIKPQNVKYDADHNYVSELMIRLNNAFLTIREQLQKCQTKQTAHYNKKTKTKTFELGHLVYLHDAATEIGISKKLTKPWTGPYRIVEIKGRVNYRIRRLNSRKQVIVHANRLNPCNNAIQANLRGKEEALNVDYDDTQMETVEQEAETAVNPRDVILTIGMGIAPQDLAPVVEVSSDEDEQTLGTVIPERPRRGSRLRRPPRRFTFSDFD